jgi:DNA-binding transcriptional LysR family regulator
MTLNLDSRKLAYFVAVVDNGGITAASEALHVAQPSLSQALAALEADLGTQLFHRVGRRLVLSAAGEALLGPARQTLRDLTTAGEAVNAVRELEAGHLELATLPTLAVDPVVRLVGSFMRLHPGVSVRVIEASTSVNVLVREGSCEVGFGELPPAGSDLQALPIGVQELFVVLPGDHKLADSDKQHNPLPLTALGDVSWVISPTGNSTRDLLEDSLAAAGVEPKIAVESDSREAIVPLVLAGAGATLLPRPLAMEAGQLGASAHPTDPAITRRLGLMYRNTFVSPAAEAFLRLASSS